MALTRISLLLAVLIAGSSSALADPTATWVNSLTPTGVAEIDYNGEMVQITMSVPTVVGCLGTGAYAVRDVNTMRSILAVATAALVAGRQLDVFVTGACDSSGLPLINSVIMH